MTRYFKDNWKKILPEGFDLIDDEHPVYGSLNNNGKVLGRTDYLFKYRHLNFITELELGKDKTEFWSAFKVLAYKNAFLLDNPMLRKHEVRPLVVLNSSNFTPNIRNVLIMTDIDYIFLTQNCEIYKMDIPYHRG